jgi:uncharacterized protein
MSLTNMAKNKVSSLDTNVLLRIILDDVPAQTASIDELFTKRNSFQVADIVIFEIVFILEKYYEMSRGDVVRSITAIIRHPQINCNRRLFELMLSAYEQNEKLSFVDCTLPHYATLNNATPLYTFDQVLAKANPDTVTLLTSHGS